VRSIHALIVIFATCLASIATAAPERPVKVYILSGQSNMDGRGRKSELVGELAKWTTPQADVRIAYSNSTRRGPFASDGFVSLGPGYSVPPGTKERKIPGDAFGPEVSFGRTIADANRGERIVLIKFSEGGTSLHNDWMPGVPHDGLYPQFLAFVRRSLKSLSDAGDEPQLAGMIWHQGESDASLPDGEYQTLLTQFIAQVRTDLDAPALPFVIGEVYDNGKRDRVRAGQRATAAAVPGVTFVAVDGLKTSDNGTHFDTPSQIELGRRLAAPFAARPPATATSRPVRARFDTFSSPTSLSRCE
jgi:iduronate 2-sulfatase